MKPLFAAAALAPLFLVSGAFAQTVSEDVTKQLWCGTALVAFFTNLPSEQLSDDEKAEAAGYVASGTALIEIAVQAHLDAGFTQEAVDKVQADLQPVVVQQIGDNTAPYSFEECLAILPAVEGGDATSSATETTSSAM